MGIAEGIVTLIATLAPIGAKLLAGRITEDEARQQSREAVDKFAAQLAQSRDDDAKRDAETDAKLDAIDARAKGTGLLADDGKDAT